MVWWFALPRDTYYPSRIPSASPPRWSAYWYRLITISERLQSVASALLQSNREEEEFYYKCLAKLFTRIIFLIYLFSLNSPRHLMGIPFLFHLSTTSMSCLQSFYLNYIQHFTIPFMLHLIWNRYRRHDRGKLILILGIWGTRSNRGVEEATSHEKRNRK